VDRIKAAAEGFYRDTEAVAGLVAVADRFEAKDAEDFIAELQKLVNAQAKDLEVLFAMDAREEARAAAAAAPKTRPTMAELKAKVDAMKARMEALKSRA
jgi:hypothetical protein